MSLQSLCQVGKNNPVSLQQSDRPRKRTSARSNSSPVQVDATPSGNYTGREKNSGQKEQLRQVFPFYQIKISRRTHSQREARPPVPKTGNAGSSHDFKNLKYQQINQEFMPKQAWAKKKPHASESFKENLPHNGVLFFQSPQDFQQEAGKLHSAVLAQLSALRPLDSLLDDNFALVHSTHSEEKPLKQQPEIAIKGEEIAKKGENELEKEGVRRCAGCGILALPCVKTDGEYTCGMCTTSRQHPVSKVEGCLAIEIEIHVDSKGAPRPPPKPPGVSRSPASLGTLTERPPAGTSLRRRNFLTPSKDVCPEIRIANKVIALGNYEKEYIYLPISGFTGEFQPFEIQKKKDPSDPITPSFNCQKHFQFSASKDEWRHDPSRRAVTEECEGISEMSETDLSRIATDLSLIEDKSELEISFSDPTNTSLGELFDAEPARKGDIHIARMIEKDLDDVLQQQLVSLSCPCPLPSSLSNLMEAYGRHTRTLIRTLLKSSPPSAVAMEKIYKGFAHLLDRVLVANATLQEQVNINSEKERAEKERIREYQVEIAQLQQSLIRIELKGQLKVESLTVQIAKYQELIALYNKELEAKEGAPSQRSTLTHFTPLEEDHSPDIIDPYT